MAAVENDGVETAGSSGGGSGFADGGHVEVT